MMKAGLCRRLHLGVDECVTVKVLVHSKLHLLAAVSGTLNVRRIPSPPGTGNLLLQGDILDLSSYPGEWDIENISGAGALCVEASFQSEEAAGPDGDPAMSPRPGPSDRMVIAALLDALGTLDEVTLAPSGGAGDRHGPTDLIRVLSTFLDTRSRAGNPPATQVGERPFTTEQRLEILTRLREGLSSETFLEDLSAHLGCSRNNLTRRFRATFGSTPTQYMTDLRIQTAKRWLRQGDFRSFQQIAVHCGFTHSANLTRTFRRHVGMTPAEYAATSLDSGRSAAPTRS